jgi:hypothetical protein
MTGVPTRAAPVASQSHSVRTENNASTVSSEVVVRRVELSWEDWRAVIAVLRIKALPYMLEHADHIERILEQHAPDESMVTLSLTDDVFLRSYNWARLQLGIPLPPD